MDRNREGRRGSSGGGPVTAPRRPRTTGFKDSSVVDDDDIMDDSHNSRLRERAKKESSNVSSLVYSGSIMSSSRNKRKRQVAHEAQIHVRSTPADDVDESTEETEMGVSEDDDDLPPPPISRKHGKLRLPAKSLDDSSAVDLSVVPRKARTAVMKRPHDSPPPVTDFPRQQSLATNPSSSGPANTVPSSSSIVLKPGRRMKPSSSKSRASKLPKVSAPTISEQEVEVAEALFDLARTVPTQASPSVSESNFDLKPEPKSESKVLMPATTVSSPAVASSSAPASAHAHVHMYGTPVSDLLVSSPAPIPVSSSAPAGSTPVLTSAPPPAEAPKRKRPRVRPKKEDGRSLQIHSAVPSTVYAGLISEVKEEFEQTGHPSTSDIVHVKTEATTFSSPGSMMGPSGSYTSTSVAVSTPPSSTLWPYSMEKKSPLVEEVKPAKSDPENIQLAENVPRNDPVPEIKDTLASSPGSSLSQKENEAASEPGGVGDSLTKLELGKRLSQSPSSDSIHPGKFEIDLMQAPPSATEVLATELTADIAGSNPVEDERAQKYSTSSTQNIWLDGGDKQLENDGCSNRDRDTDKELVQGDLNRADEQVVCGDFKKFEETETQNENLKEREWEKEKAELAKQTSQKMAKNKVDSRSQKTERSGAPSFLLSVPPASSSMLSSITSPSLQISLGMGGWPLGYYSPAAAASATWPTGSSVSGASMDENTATACQVPPLVFPGARQLWKRCSSHVYIAHFIGWQQQIQRRPLWAAMYGNTATGLYGNKPYNLNIPLPSGEGVFVTGTGSLTGSSGSSAIGPGSGVNGLGLVPLKERSLISPETLLGSKERVTSSYLDALARKTPQQPAQMGQQLPLPLQAGPAFGFPVTQAAVSAMGNVPAATTGSGTATGGTNSLIGVLGPSSSPAVATSSGALVGAGVGTTNGSVVNAAAAHVQYLIQQAGFPFSFPPTHFGPTFNGPPGHIAQAPQFYGSHPHLYNTHLVQPLLHSHQSQMTADNISSGFLSSQLQHLQQAVRNIQSSGSPQRQPPPPPSPSQSQQQQSIGAAASQQLQRPLDREGNMGGESSSTAESKYSALQRNVYSQTNPNMQLPGVNCSAAPMAGMPSLHAHPQDFSLTAAFGGKQTGKLQQQHQQASVQLQAQQSTVSSSSQQQHVTGHHHMGPALQMSIKGLEQVPQSFPSMPMRNIARSSVGPGPLGLAPVAAVMAPQGHAMLQGMADPIRGHGHIQSIPGLPHQHSVLQGQQQHPVFIQKASSSGVDDSCVNTDESSYTSGSRGRDPAEDRKVPVKRTFVPIGLSRVDLEVSSNAQGSPPAGNVSGLAVPRMAGSPDTSVNLMISSMGNFSSRPSGQSSRNASGPAPASNQSLKSSMGRSKAMASNTSIPPSATMADPSFSPFTDRTLGATLGKAPPPGTTFPGLNVNNGNQTLKQGHASHNVSQIKVAQKTSLGSQAPSAPTQPPVALAATMAKHQGQPQPRGQQSVINMVAAGSRVSPAASGSVSGAIPLPPLAPVSKSSGVAVAKNASMTKSSFPVSQKSTASVKKLASAVSPTAPSIIAPSSVAQNTPVKAMQPQHQHSMQQQQHASQSLQQNHTLTAAQQAVSQQYHQQLHNSQMSVQSLPKQALQPQQQLQMRQQYFLHQQQQRQQFYQQQEHQHQQQLSQSQSRSSVVQPQAMVHSMQHQTGQVARQQSVSSGTLSQQQFHTAQQQVLKHVQPPQALQSSQQYPLQASFGVSSMNGLSLATPNLSLGTGSSGKNNSSDGVGVLTQATGSRPSTPVKSTGNTISHPNASSRRNNNAGSTFLHSQMASSNCSTSGQQQMGISGTSVSNSPYMQSGPVSAQVGRLVEDKPLSDGLSQDRFNGICLMPGTSPARLSQSSSGTAMSPPPFRPQTGASTVKHTGHQCVPGHMGEALSSRSGMSMSSSHSGMHSTCGPLNTVPISVNGTQVTGVHLNSDGKGMLAATAVTVHQGGSGQQHQPLPTSGQSGITMSANVAPNVVSGGPAVLVCQSSAGTVQP